MTLVAALVEFVLLPVYVIGALLARSRRRQASPSKDKKIVWGSTPIKNNSYWSRSLREAGYDSEVFTSGVYAINSRTDFDRVLCDEYTWAPMRLRAYIAFWICLLRYDVFITSFEGLFPFKFLTVRAQGFLTRLAGVRVVVIPYGADSYIYRRIRSAGLQHGLLLSYPLAARRQDQIARRVDYWCRHADVVVTGFPGIDGFGRWDVCLPSALFIDASDWRPKASYNSANGVSGLVKVYHAPNHRGFKGTEFIVDAVEKLKDEGLHVELILLEHFPNHEVQRLLLEDADILVDQLIYTGHGLNALEGMSTGLVTVSNLDNEEYLVPFRRWAYFNECPLVSATPETITDVLRKLVTNPELRETLGQMGREYVEKYHGLDSSRYLFEAVIDYVYGRRGSLMDLYHPLTSPYVKRQPRIEPPLTLNRLPGHGSDHSRT